MNRLMCLIAVVLVLGIGGDTCARSYRPYGMRRGTRYSASPRQRQAAPAECPCKKRAREAARRAQLAKEKGKIYLFVFPAENEAGAIIDLQRSREPQGQLENGSKPINWEGPYETEAEARKAAKDIRDKTDMPFRDNGI